MVRENRKVFLLYPEDTLKGYWDLTISLALILTCSITPYAIAFEGEKDTTWNIFDIIIDIMFGIDIVLIFNSAYYDDDFKLIEQYN